MDPIQQNVQGVKDLVSSKVNKVPYDGNNSDDVNAERIDQFTLKLSDEELISLAKRWTDKYRGYEAQIKPRQEANKKYYLGKQEEGGPKVVEAPISANILFEAEETFLPAALSKNPEPVVYADNTEKGNKISGDVKTMLQYHADVLVLRRKLALTVRHWSIYFLGILKHGWDADIDDIKLEVRNPQNFIFDPDGYVDCYGDYIGYLGERITVSADRLVEMFPEHKAYIIIAVGGKMGTDVTYTEWWNDDYTFCTFKDIVLDKSKNPHFNYDSEEEETNEYGEVEVVEKKGENHFSKPKKPYTFLSVFSLAQQPHDITGLIEQNIPNQRRVSRRTEQLDFNLSRANNSDIFSENNFTQETAKQAAQALVAGRPVIVPSGGPLREAIVRLNAPAIGAEFFRELEVSKQDLRSIFGTEGISSQPSNENTTARGMILNQQFDNTRIGGGIGDALEQVADNVFNWWVQMYKVYYTEPHFATIMGQMKAVEYITLQASDINRKIVVSVAADSMKPHDEITEMNQALSLWKEGAIDPKTLLTRLNVPDPQKTAEATVLWLIDKEAYLQLNFPEVAQQLAQLQQQRLVQGAQPPPGSGGEAPIPESPTPTLSENPASASLSNVPINVGASLPQ